MYSHLSEEDERENPAIKLKLKWYVPLITNQHLSFLSRFLLQEKRKRYFDPLELI